MSLPPEQINIKRRREEEPVETLYIQDELHQTKRRFTDFVFQRVLAGGDGATKPSPSLSPAGPAAQRTLRTPRSVSSLKPRSASGAPRNAAGGVPSVRATSPGAEFREQKRVAAARREAEEKFTRALHSGPVRPDAATGVGAQAEPEPEPEVDATSGRSSALSGRRNTPSPNASVRKFQISRSSTPAGLRKNVGGGVQKRRGESVPGVAVLVEKLRQPHSRKASMVSDLLTGDGAVPAGKLRIPLASEEGPARPRKRPVVNQAERRWREDRQNAISTAKQRIAKMADAGQSDSDDESERLAQQFEQVALDLESGMDAEATEEVQPAPTKPAPAPPKPPLKYQPRVPNKARPAAAPERSVDTDDPMQVDTAHATPQPHGPEHDNDSDGEYVYDTYIRRPLGPSGPLSNPLADLEKDQDTWFRQRGIDTTRPDIGVIVIPAEDEQYWENFAEDDEDEDRWDSEDADSNAENNPANDYPDEELSWDDEDDDPTAIYSRYRARAASDDEEFDIYDSASEGEDRFGY